jgi:RimK family alpha-L-glutamate ligase
VRALLLTALPELEANQRLEAALTAIGLDTRVVDVTRVVAAIGSGPALLAAGTDLLDPAPDVVLARVGNWRPESLLAALEAAESAGAATPNPAASIRLGRDHWRTAHRLEARGVAVPPTLVGAEPEALAATAIERLGLPVVVKQRRSRMGVGVILCETRDHLEAVLDSLWRMGDEVVVQGFVDTGGASVRALVVDGAVVAAARFQAPPTDWRSNAARGGSAHACALDPATSDLACRAAAAVGLGVCGVDLLPGSGGMVVGEVNPTPGFRALEAATGVDVAAAIADCLRARVRVGRR